MTDLTARETTRWGWWFFAEGQLRSMRNYLSVIVVSALGEPLLILLVMGVGLGSLIGANTGLVEGVSYIQFLAPALLASTAMMAASAEFTYEVMASFKWLKKYYGAAATTLSPGHIMGGHVAAVLIRFIVQTVLVMGLFALFGLFDSWLALLQLLTVPLVGLAVGLPIGAYVSQLEHDRGQIATIQRFIIMPLFLFSGTFYPLSQLPSFLQWVGWISPQWHGAQLGRVLSYGAEEPGWMIALHVLILVAMAAVGWVLMHRNFNRRLGAQ